MAVHHMPAHLGVLNAQLLKVDARKGGTLLRALRQLGLHLRQLRLQDATTIIRARTCLERNAGDTSDVSCSSCHKLSFCPEPPELWDTTPPTSAPAAWRRACAGAPPPRPAAPAAPLAGAQSAARPAGPAPAAWRWAGRLRLLAPVS